LVAIEVTNLTKSYKGFKALEDVSFSIEEGKMVLLLGPNGAGKTTLLRCMLGIVHFDGDVRISGLDVKKNGKEARRLIGYLPQIAGIDGAITCTQVLDLFSNLRRVSITLEDGLGPFDLLQKADAKVSSLSGGMKRKLSIAVSLLGDPPIMFMDEPFGDLDARGRLDLLSTLKELRAQGRTVVVSTHTVGGVLNMADVVLVLHKGRPLKIMKPQQIASSLIPTYRIHVFSGEENIRYLEEKVEVFPTGWTTITSRDLYGTLAKLAGAGIDISKAMVEEPSTNELIARLASNDV
jgi:ABC-type multidrug transport system ATPase subunit